MQYLNLITYFILFLIINVSSRINTCLRLFFCRRQLPSCISQISKVILQYSNLIIRIIQAFSELTNLLLRLVILQVSGTAVLGCEACLGRFVGSSGI